MQQISTVLIIWNVLLVYFPSREAIADDIFYLMTSKKWVLEKQRSSTALDYDKENMESFSITFRKDLSGIYQYTTKYRSTKSIPFRWNIENSPTGEIILTTINMSMERSEEKTILGEPRNEAYFFIRPIRKPGYEDQLRLTITNEKEGIPIHLYLK